MRACLWAFGCWLSNRFFLNPKPSRNFRLKSVLELEAVGSCCVLLHLNQFETFVHIFEAQAILSFLSSSDTILGNSKTRYTSCLHKQPKDTVAKNDDVNIAHFETKSRSSPAVGIVSALIEFLGQTQHDPPRPFGTREGEGQRKEK